jgi:hypothetical protein
MRGENERRGREIEERRQRGVEKRKRCGEERDREKEKRRIISLISTTPVPAYLSPTYRSRIFSCI